MCTGPNLKYERTVIIKENGDFEFSGDLFLGFSDAFVDPFDFNNKIKKDIDFPGAKPFKIYGSWKEIFFGKGKTAFKK